MTQRRSPKQGEIEEAYHISAAWVEKTTGSYSKFNPSFIPSTWKKQVGHEFKRKSKQYPSTDDIRDEKSFAGLKNLGATCYMNALVQVLFSTRKFRQGIYLWDGNPKDEPIIYQLQVLFVALQKSIRTFYDPKPFVEAMQCNAAVQQDAQEFFKALITYLERAFEHSNNPQVKELICNQFEGKSEYVTICRSCQSVSRNKGMFHEIDVTLEGFVTLEDCLHEWLGVESLEGDNQYRCATCQSLQNAQRSISLTKLPEILNFQLLRFVYNKDLGHRCKVKQNIYFPVSLDMKPFMTAHHKPTLKAEHSKEGQPIDIISYQAEAQKCSDDEYQYDLTAYLVHKGASSIGGHYVAHILDEDSKKWLVFDDETVSDMELNESMYTLDPKKDLEHDDDKKKKPKKIPAISLTRGYFKSQNCYFLTYSKRTERSGRAKIKPEPPKDILKQIENDNQEFKGIIQALEKEAESNQGSEKAHKLLVEEVFSSMGEVGSGVEEECNWIPAEWLKGWISGAIDKKPNEEKKIDMTTLLCRHDKLDKDQLENMKRIKKAAWDILSQHYGVKGKPLSEEDYCHDCVALELQERDSGRSTKDTLEALVTAIKKHNSKEGLDDDDAGYYVCPQWFSQFSKKGFRLEDEKNERGNTEIQCRHGKLKLPKKGKLKIVDPLVWAQIRSLFPRAIEFPRSVMPCKECAFFKEERKKVLPIINKIRAPITEITKNDTLFLVPQSWAKCCEHYLDQDVSPPGVIETDQLLCEHHLLNFSLDGLWMILNSASSENTEPHSLVGLVDQEDWVTLKNRFGISGPPISFILSDGGSITTSIEGCQACIHAREQQEANNDLVFQNQEIKIEFTSQRRTTTRNTRQGKLEVLRIKCSFSDTLNHLKLLIYQLKEISPAEQSIFFDGQEMKDSRKTLGAYGVVPSKTLKLYRVEGNDDHDELVILSGQSHREEKNVGFASTALSARPSIPSQTKPVVWVCGACTLENPIETEKCDACEAPNPKMDIEPVIETDNSVPEAKSLKRKIEATSCEEKPTKKIKKVFRIGISSDEEAQ